MISRATRLVMATLVLRLHYLRTSEPRRVPSQVLKLLILIVVMPLGGLLCLSRIVAGVHALTSFNTCEENKVPFVIGLRFFRIAVEAGAVEPLTEHRLAWLAQSDEACACAYCEGLTAATGHVDDSGAWPPCCLRLACLARWRPAQYLSPEDIDRLSRHEA